jgi:hypothetical protein
MTEPINRFEQSELESATIRNERKAKILKKKVKSPDVSKMQRIYIPELKLDLFVEKGKDIEKVKNKLITNLRIDRREESSKVQNYFINKT